MSNLPRGTAGCFVELYELLKSEKYETTIVRRGGRRCLSARCGAMLHYGAPIGEIAGEFPLFLFCVPHAVCFGTMRSRLTHSSTQRFSRSVAISERRQFEARGHLSPESTIQQEGGSRKRGTASGLRTLVRTSAISNELIKEANETRRGS